MNNLLDGRIEIVSGEGEGQGTVERFAGKTLLGLKRRLNKDRANGDRWAYARYVLPANIYGNNYERIDD